MTSYTHVDATVFIYKGKWYIVPCAYTADGFRTDGPDWFTVDAAEPAEKKGELVYGALRRSGKKLPYDLRTPIPRSQNMLLVMTGVKQLTKKIPSQIWDVHVILKDDQIAIYPSKKVSPWQALFKQPVRISYPSPPEKLTEAIIEAFRQSEPPPPEEYLLGSATAQQT